jgi:hypothetical protein
MSLTLSQFLQTFLTNPSKLRIFTYAKLLLVVRKTLTVQTARENLCLVHCFLDSFKQ